ncbi:YdcF family protein [Thiomicrorhabdus immobilis]|uniref:YdcF family protein n=1 Tax=Thiomicrorhabdus immobilis TaxID=2791037 RepID=UPI0028801263|nr:YdcF family protein [Thiomicrorhabdus immobilis]
MFFLFFGVVFLVFNKISAAKKILIPTGLVAFVLMAYPISDYLMKPLEERFSTPSVMPEKIDGIIILGGGEDLKRSLSWKVAELGLGGDRYIGTASLALAYPNVPVIFTGGSGLVSLQNSEGEGALARQILTTIGIQESRLIIESKSRNTYENFKYTKVLLPKPQGTYLLVTSSFHMPRSVGVARAQGINVIPYPVDYRTNADELRIFDFDLFDHLKALEPAWREWVGLTVYYFTDKTANWFPKPGEIVEKKSQKVIPGFYSDKVNTFEP